MTGLLRAHRVVGFERGREPETACRAVMAEGVLRFEFMFVTPVALIGTALDGWTDISGATEQFLEWSADKVSWQRRQFEGSREVLRADGKIEIWAMSAHPLDGPGAVRSQFARLGVHFHRRHRNWR